MKKKIGLLLVLALLAMNGCSTQENTVADHSAAETTERREVEGAAIETLPEETLAEDILPEDTLPEDTLPQEAGESVSSGRTSVRPEASDGFDEGAWARYLLAKEAMDGLAAREEQFLVNTKQMSGGNEASESVDVRLKRTGLDQETPQFSAVGTVKTQGGNIPLEMYYQDGTLYSISGTAKVKKTADYADSVATVDILGGFSAQLKKEYIISMSYAENADGTVFLELSFHGNINQVDTSGSGELILNSKGYIISQKYILTAEVEQDGVPATVEQSVECTLLSYGDSVKPIEFPAPEDFIEVE